MSTLPSSPFWSRNHDIPICVVTGEDSDAPLPKQNHRRTCPTCDTCSTDQSIHCITIASPAPPSYHSTPTPAIPRLQVQTSHQWPHPQAPRRALRFDAKGKPRMRFPQSTFSPLSPETSMNDIDHGRNSHSSGFSIPNTPEDDTRTKLGLGIQEAPFKSDPSPIQSSHRNGGSPAKSAPDVVQRIERKLWQYSSSDNVIKRWLFEIISWLLSALCMIAIIILLIVFKNKSVPSNMLFGLTLNDCISTLSKIASAALLLPASEALGQLKWSWFQGDRSKKVWDFEIFDNASRGPWGSFLLLARTRGRTLAALGAAVMIFAIALDPFFQQVARYPTRWERQAQNGTIPRVIRYEPASSKEYRYFGNETDHAELLIPNRDMAAIAEKFFFDFGVPQVKVGNGTRAEIPLSCPTSNCTWEPYETLGVCSECSDVADMLEFACTYAQFDWIETANSYDERENGTMCGWFFNATGEKPMLMSGYQVDPTLNQSSGMLTTRALPLVTNINRRPLFGGSIKFKHIRNKITDFVVVTAGNGSDLNGIMESIKRHDRPRAVECMLSWCVKTIESSYYLASYTETVKDHFINTTAGPYPWTTFNATDDGEYVYKVYFENITVDPHAPDGQGDISSYGVSNDTAFNVLIAFDNYLPSFATVKNNDTSAIWKYGTRDENPVTREVTKNPWSAPTNVTDHMERLAMLMTNTIRMASEDAATGIAWAEETYVQVVWAWLSLPLVLLILTLVFLVATVVRTSKESDRLGVWKTSALATLLYGLPDDIQKEMTDSQANGTPRTRAREMRVRMLPKKGWRVSEKPVASRNKSEPPPGWV